MVLDYLVHNFTAANAALTRANFDLGLGHLRLIGIGLIAIGGPVDAEIGVREEGKSPILLEHGQLWSGDLGGDMTWQGDVPVTSDYQARLSIRNDSGVVVTVRVRIQLEDPRVQLEN